MAKENKKEEETVSAIVYVYMEPANTSRDSYGKNMSLPLSAVAF